MTRDDVITKTELDNDDSFVSVEIELCGDNLEKLVETAALKKYKPYLIEADGVKSLRIMRSSEESKITQNKKEKVLTVGNVRVFNADTNQFENPTGIDATITALFDAQFVWADTNSGDVADFSKTKICGKIINTIISDKISDSWDSFKKSHKDTFEKIADNLKPIEEKIQSKLSEQYGSTEVKFNFTLPEITDFLKSGHIDLSDNGIQTTSAEKGTGMQRALALALIQVYADITSSGKEDVSKPIMFFIDEPETFLHPQAQNKLLDSLEKISNNSQVFIVTHSPYLLKKYKKDTHSLNIFSKNSAFNQVKKGKAFDLFGASSPTWGEINYYAFGVISVEFHNELYGFVQAKAIVEDERNYCEDAFEQYLVARGIEQNKTYVRLKKDGTTQSQIHTLPTLIRNVIHHPENTNNSFTDDDLRMSIEALISLYS
ncbi:MAG: ATP-dependent endonuclease [Candidatus Saccharibacteria bacterium]